MIAKGPAAELLALRRFVSEAESKFLQPHIAHNSLGTPTRAEELDVAAFVVLAHGAVENFIEGIALWVVGSIEHSWVMKKRASRSLASLLMYKDAPADDCDDEISVFDNIREAI